MTMPQPMPFFFAAAGNAVISPLGRSRPWFGRACSDKGAGRDDGCIDLLALCAGMA